MYSVLSGQVSSGQFCFVPLKLIIVSEGNSWFITWNLLTSKENADCDCLDNKNRSCNLHGGVDRLNVLGRYTNYY